MTFPVNFKLLSNPANWAIVLLTVAIGVFAVHSIKPTSNNNS